MGSQTKTVTIQKKWHFSWITLLITVSAIGAATLFTYPYAAQWVTQYNQSNVIVEQAEADKLTGKAQAEEMIAAAHAYNDLLQSRGILRGGAHIAAGTGKSNSDLEYNELLNNDPKHIMARLRIPSINLDQPVYHGTSDSTLEKGVGHLEGTSLPVGGIGTRTVLTGHRGLANAEIFTNLNKVKVGDRFNIEVMGQIFSYKVNDVIVVRPNDTEEIRAVEGKDLATLITCTPLGINTHRILVTGERIIPTPKSDLDAAGSIPDVPRFPWWAIIYLATAASVLTWYWRSGYTAPKRSSAKLKE